MGRAARDLRSDAALFVYGRHWHPVLSRHPRVRNRVVDRVWTLRHAWPWFWLVRYWHTS